jgi:hypothetical protein
MSLQHFIRANRSSLSHGLYLLVASLATGTACSSSETDPIPTTPIVVTDSGAGGAPGSRGSPGTGGQATGGGGSGGSDTEGGAGAGGDAGIADVVNDQGPIVIDASTCNSDGGCVCILKTTTDFLNQCSGSQCAHFDNEGRLPLYNHGVLPAP